MTPPSLCLPLLNQWNASLRWRAYYHCVSCGMNEPRLCWKGVMLYLACTKWLILKGGLQEVVSWQSTSYSCWFCLPSSQGLGWRVPAAGIGGTAGLRAQGQKTNAFSLWRACSRSWYGNDVLEVTFVSSLFCYCCMQCWLKHLERSNTEVWWVVKMKLSEQMCCILFGE